MSHMLNPLGATRTTDDPRSFEAPASQKVADMEAAIGQTYTRLCELADELKSIANDLQRRAESFRPFLPR